MEGILEKIFVVKRVAEKLWKTEESVDAAMADASKLMGDMIESRKELGLSPVVTDAATQKVADAMRAIADARAALVAAHSELAELKLRIGVRTKMDGAHKLPPVVQDDDAEIRRTA